MTANNTASTSSPPGHDSHGSWCISSWSAYPELPLVPCAPGYHQGSWDEVLGHAGSAATPDLGISGLPDPGQIGSAISGATSGLAGVGDFFGWLKGKLTSGTFWKGTGLALGGVVLVLAGLVLWTGHGRTAMRAAEAA